MFCASWVINIPESFSYHLFRLKIVIRIFPANPAIRSDGFRKYLLVFQFFSLSLPASGSRTAVQIFAERLFRDCCLFSFGPQFLLFHAFQNHPDQFFNVNFQHVNRLCQTFGSPEKKRKSGAANYNRMNYVIPRHTAYDLQDFLSGFRNRDAEFQFLFNSIYYNICI